MQTIYEKLMEYGQSDYYGFHMPGHKRNKKMMDANLPFEIDITEIEGFDDLHHADGIIKEAEARAARLYHAQETHFLVNGSTVGILSAILGCTESGGKILAARNCHKSVYHAIFLNKLNPVYIYPDFCKEQLLSGEIKAGEIQRLLEEEPEIQAVVVVSPTYDGVVSDLKRIAEVVHEKGIPLIVDEAHGAHFGFHAYFPQNANQCGADVVINSTHKTLPALTQTALLHINGLVVDRERIRSYLHMLQSSSPSYVLMASIDVCMDGLERCGKTWFDDYVERLKCVRKKLQDLKYLQLAETELFDNGKLVIGVSGAGIGSRELYINLWKQYSLQMEMSSGEYVLAMTSVGDTEQGFSRLAGALLEIDSGLSGGDRRPTWGLPAAEVIETSAQNDRRVRLGTERQYLPWKSAIGYISTEYAYLYPPGCPLIVPGERFTSEVASCLERYRAAGFTIEGLKKNDEIGVWPNG